ncbi:transposase [Burkholderia oklahomensis]|nr:transposase [Burkholderia oklahomensis]QPS36482.1 transposase [Burkholderia oklahomensis]
MDTFSLIGIDPGEHCVRLACAVRIGPHGVPQEAHTRPDADAAGQSSALYGGHGSVCGRTLGCAMDSALGHQAKLISPQFAKPFLQGDKNDFADAQAIREAASRPCMRFVSPRATRLSSPSRRGIGRARGGCGIAPAWSVRSTPFCRSPG